MEQSKESNVVPDSIGTVNHLPSANKIMFLQKAIKDKKIIVTGSTLLTAEAWEHDRKMRIHKQLKLARKLRCVMEGALEEAKKATNAKEAKKIFFNHRDEMLQLASLSSAVVGGYTLDSYNEYIDLEKEEEEQDQKSFEKSQKYLNGLQQRLVWENSPSTFFRDYRENLQRSERQAKEAKAAASSSLSIEEMKETSLTTAGSKSKLQSPTNHGGKSFNTSTPQSSSPSKFKSDYRKSSKHTKARTPLEKKLRNEAGTPKLSSSSPSASTISATSSNRGMKKVKTPQSKSINKFMTNTSKVDDNDLMGDITKNTSSKKRSYNKTHTKKETSKPNDIQHELAKRSIHSASTTTSTSKRSASPHGSNKSSTLLSTNKYFNSITSKSNSTSSISVQNKKASSMGGTTRTEKATTFKTTKKGKGNKVKPKVARKCHHCKQVKDHYYLCGYWFDTGNRCKKVFCHDCTSIYDIKGADSEDWHCPSCLKMCKCPVCVKDRERDLLRVNKRRRLRG